MAIDKEVWINCCRDVRTKAVYIALGILPGGMKEIRGIWIELSEGAKFWLSVRNELKNRGLADILIAVVDGLKGCPAAIMFLAAMASLEGVQRRQACLRVPARQTSFNTWAMALGSFHEARPMAFLIRCTMQA